MLILFQSLLISLAFESELVVVFAYLQVLIFKRIYLLLRLLQFFTCINQLLFDFIEIIIESLVNSLKLVNFLSHGNDIAL